MHHDALEFPDGRIVLLTRLVPGQRATVLQLPAEPRTKRKPRNRKGLRLSPDRVGTINNVSDEL